MTERTIKHLGSLGYLPVKADCENASVNFTYSLATDAEMRNFFTIS